MAVIEIEVSQMIVFSQDDTTWNPRALTATNTLVINQAAKNYRQSLAASNFINFGQTASVRKSINHITVSQYLELHHSGHKSAGNQVISQWINFGQIARLVEYERIQQTLTIVQTVTVQRAKAAKNTIVFTQTVNPTLVRTRVVAQTLVIHSGGVGIVEDEDRYSISLPTLLGPNAPECTS